MNTNGTNTNQTWQKMESEEKSGFYNQYTNNNNNNNNNNIYNSNKDCDLCWSYNQSNNMMIKHANTHRKSGMMFYIYTFICKIDYKTM